MRHYLYARAGMIAIIAMTARLHSAAIVPHDTSCIPKTLRYRDTTALLSQSIHSNLICAVNLLAGLPTAITESRYNQTMVSYRALIKNSHDLVESLNKHYTIEAYTHDNMRTHIPLFKPQQAVTDYMAQFITHAIRPLKKDLNSIICLVPDETKNACNLEKLHSKTAGLLLFWRYAHQAVQYWDNNVENYITQLTGIKKYIGLLQDTTPGWRTLVHEQLQKSLLPAIQKISQSIQTYEHALYDDLHTDIPTAVTPRYKKRKDLYNHFEKINTFTTNLITQLTSNKTITLKSIQKELKPYIDRTETLHHEMHAIRLPLLPDMLSEQQQTYIRRLQFPPKVPQRASGFIENALSKIQASIDYAFPTTHPVTINTRPQKTEPVAQQPHQPQRQALIPIKPLISDCTPTDSIIEAARHNTHAIIANAHAYLDQLTNHVTGQIDHLSRHITKPTQDIAGGISTMKDTLGWIKDITVTTGSCPADFLIPALKEDTTKNNQSIINGDTGSINSWQPPDEYYLTALDRYKKYIDSTFRPHLAEVQALVAADDTLHTRYYDRIEAIEKATNTSSNHISFVLAAIKKYDAIRKEILDDHKKPIEAIEQSTNTSSNHISFVLQAIKKYDAMRKQILDNHKKRDTRLSTLLNTEAPLAYHYPEQAVALYNAVVTKNETDFVNPLLRAWKELKKIVQQNKARISSATPFLNSLRNIEKKLHHIVPNSNDAMIKFYALKNDFSAALQQLYNENSNYYWLPERGDYIEKLIPFMGLAIENNNTEEKKRVNAHRLLETIIQNKETTLLLEAGQKVYSYFEKQYQKQQPSSILITLFAQKAVPRLQEKLAQKEADAITTIEHAINNNQNEIDTLKQTIKQYPFTFIQPFWSWLYKALTGKETAFAQTHRAIWEHTDRLVRSKQQKNTREQLKQNIINQPIVIERIDTSTLAPGIEANIDYALDAALSEWEKSDANSL